MRKGAFLVCLSPFGALLSGICFFFPWVKVSSIYELSGIERGGALWILIALSGVILVTFFFAARWRQIARFVILAASILGIIVMAAVFYQVWTAEILFIDVKTIFEVKLQPAGIGMVAGFIFAIIGSVFMNNSQPDDI